MNMSGSWRRNKSTHKAKRVRHKPKIRWDQLGLSNPDDVVAPVSMDEIRKQVVALASHGFGQETRSRSLPGNRQGGRAVQPSAPRRIKRRGATE